MTGACAPMRRALPAVSTAIGARSISLPSLRRWSTMIFSPSRSAPVDQAIEEALARLPMLSEQTTGSGKIAALRRIPSCPARNASSTRRCST